MRREKNIASQVFGLKVLLFASQGDSGGPLWVREDEGGDLPIAYLVKKNFAVFWSTLNLFAIFSCIDSLAISQISPSSSPTSSM